MKNELKRRVKAGEQVYGTWITVESPIMTEMMSNLGFDYFVIDTEHAPLDPRMAQTLMQAMRPDIRRSATNTVEQCRSRVFKYFPSRLRLL